MDYLKLDIEGAESEVLTSIRGQLHLVRAIGLEFHGTGPGAPTEEEGLLALLRESGFRVSISRKGGSIFPPDIHAWVERVHPHVSVINAVRAP
ncbi:MAG: FkbM family methyltransferase [Gemmatimonadales bacterium]